MEQPWIRIVFRRRVFIITLIMVQLAFIMFAIASTHFALHYMDVILKSFSIIVCIHILNKKDNSAYKLTWIFLILLFPLFGGPVYVFFYTQSSPRKLRRKTEEITNRYRPFFKPDDEVTHEISENHRECVPQVRYLQDYAGFPIYKRTQTQYFDSGESFFAQVLSELQKAKRYIFLEFFIMRQGKMLDPIIAILAEKARAGLDVRIMYDDLGCFTSLPPHFNETLENLGIKCLVFGPFKPILSSLQNNRDHRKIISIDGEVAFTGGINLADEYINARARFGHWKDSAIMLSGEAAWGLTLIFLHMWNLNSKVEDDVSAFYPWATEPCSVESDGYVQPYADTPIDKRNVGEHVYIQIMNDAKEYLYINTPYLVIDDKLLSALILAAKSGIDVRIITPYRWDKWIVSVVSRSYYRQLILSGVKVYEYSAGFNHSKSFVSDDRVATVGTTNLDFRSLYLHYECGVWMYKTKTVATIKEDFLSTLASCKEITLADCARNALQRITQDVLRIFAPLM